LTNGLFWKRHSRRLRCALARARRLPHAAAHAVLASDRNRGDKRNQNIIDSTGRFAARTLASGLHAGLTSPARPWMKLTTPDPDLAEHGRSQGMAARRHAAHADVFATSNLYNVLPLVYLDMGVFGTAAMSIVEDTRDLFRCYSYPIGSYALGLDNAAW
jgi:hypothetical protein